MSELFFKTDFHSSELRSLVLPVEIRRSNLALVKRSDTSQSVDLDPGVYYVSAKLPAGQVLLDKVTISADAPSTVILAPAPGEQSPSESMELSLFISGKPILPLSSGSETTSTPPPLGPDTISARLRVFASNVSRTITLEPDSQQWVMVQQSPAPGEITFFCRAASPPVIRQIQLLQSGERPVNVLIPVSPQESCQLLLRRLPNLRFSIDMHLEHIAADALVHYFQQGLIEQAAALTETNALQAKELLRGKLEHPIAAAAGAYVLLRLGDLEKLHNWTENLYNFFAWLPDGAAIRGEHLARIGQHEQALNTFLSLSKRGLPLLSDGLSYAVSRLRTYVASGTQFAQTAQSEAESLLKQLQRLAAFVDFRLPFLTYSGLDPNNPDDVPVGEDISGLEGVDVISLLQH
jgi:hypothetical protein